MLPEGEERGKPLLAWFPFDLSSIADLIVTFWYVVVGVVGGIVSLIALFEYVHRLRPCCRNQREMYAYIDFESNEMVEEKELVLFWGKWWIGRKIIQLPAINRSSRYILQYKPKTSFRTHLPSRAYEERTKGDHRHLVLTNKHVFDEGETDVVHLHTSTTISDQSYRTQVKEFIDPVGVRIENGNAEEIRNYPINLPPEFLSERIPQLVRNNHPNITRWKQENQRIVIFVGKIDPAIGSSPGIILIMTGSDA